MTRLSAMAVIVVIGLQVMTLYAAEPEGKRIVVTGRAVGVSMTSEEEAKQDALREAVRRVCGSFINAQSQTEDFELVRDKILEQPVGFARIVKVLKGPDKHDDITQIQLEAEVFPILFERRWAEFAHIKQREGNPRCVVIVAEDSDTDDAVPPQVGGVVQSELENFFLSKDVQLMDKGVTDQVRVRDLTLAAMNGDVNKAAAAGAAFKADVVVLGQAEAKKGDSVVVGGQTLKRWNVTLTIRAIQTDSAAVLVSKTYIPDRAMTTTSGSGKDGLLRVARDNAPEVLSDIAEAWRKRATVGKLIQVTLDPCTRPQFKAIQAEMIKLKGITGAEDGFKLREIVNNIATVEVSWKYDLNQLADRFEELKVRVGDDKLSFEVTEQSANRVVIRVRSEGSVSSEASAPRESAESQPGK